MKLAQVIAKYPDRAAFIKAVNEQLVKLMDENPDFKYTDKSLFVKGIEVATCKYNGPPTTGLKTVGPPSKGCIFGQVLQNMGWSDNNEMSIMLGINSLLQFEDAFGASWVDIGSWRSIQAEQDRGESWGSLKRYLSCS
jgi:hypothetical protein